MGNIKGMSDASLEPWDESVMKIRDILAGNLGIFNFVVLV